MRGSSLTGSPSRAFSTNGSSGSQLGRPAPWLVAALVVTQALWAVPLWAQVGDESDGIDQPQATDGISVEFHRTWSSGDVTMIDGLADVPLAMLSASTTAIYHFDLTVFDQAGSALYTDGWDRKLSERAARFIQPGSSMLEPFQFGVMPGEYEVQVRAYPTDAPDLGQSQRVSVSGFGSRPVASDLFLANRVERLTEDAGGGSWSVSRGGFGIAAAVATKVMPEQPELYYYLELYSGEESWTASISASVAREDGFVVYETPAMTAEVGPGGIPFTGRLPLTGLPAGRYTLTMAVEGAKEPVLRSSGFTMLDRESVRMARDDSFESRHFASLSDEELAYTYGGIVVLLQRHEGEAFESLPPDAKRRYLSDFFRARNPDPYANTNSFLDEYVSRVQTVRSRVSGSVGLTRQKPWLTDMGRIYIRSGEPQDRIVNHFPADEGNPLVRGANSFGGEPPYEIWAYRRGHGGYVYLFVAEDRFDNWRMIYSTDPNANTLADWGERVGGAALLDLRDNFGIQPRFRTGIEANQ